MGLTGDSANRVQFGEYIHKNMSLGRFRNNWKMSMSEAAYYVRYAPFT